MIWDLMRLEILARQNNAVCYFILSGFNKKIIPLLENTFQLKKSCKSYNYQADKYKNNYGFVKTTSIN
jgi:hypothetical protein